MKGKRDWLDFSLLPYSPRLKRTVTWEEDCEEWTRSLVSAYKGTVIGASLLHDDAQNLSERISIKRHRWPFIVGFLVIVLALLAVYFIPHHKTPSFTLAAGPPPSSPLSSSPQEVHLTSSQASSLASPINELVLAHNTWVTNCLPLAESKNNACMVPSLQNMNSLTNQARVITRQLESSLQTGACHTALENFDNQLYVFHQGLLKTGQGFSGNNGTLASKGLVLLQQEGSILGTTISKTLPAECLS